MYIYIPVYVYTHIHICFDEIAIPYVGTVPDVPNIIKILPTINKY